MKKFCYTISGMLLVLLIGVLGFKYLGGGVDKKVESAFNKLSDIDNYSMKVYLEVASKIEDQTNTVKVESQVDQFSPQKIMMTMSSNISMFGVEFNNVKTYYEKVGNTTYVYQQDLLSGSDAFSKTVLDDDDSDPFSVDAVMAINPASSGLKKVGTETIDGKKYSKIQATVSEEFLKDNTFVDSAAQTSRGKMDPALFNKIKIYVYVDLEKEEFKRLEFDFMDYMKEYMKANQEELTGGEVSKYIMYVDIDNIGAVADFDFPEVTESPIDNSNDIDDFKLELNIDMPDLNS